MPIRLQSPDPLMLQAKHRKRLYTTTSNFLKTPAGRVLTCSVLTWLLSYCYCRHLFWRDPDSWFYDSSRSYEFRYTYQRQIEARAFIDSVESTIPGNGTLHRPSVAPVICVGMVSVKRKGEQYLNDTIASMLVELTDEERSVLNVQLLFADIEPSHHPDWNKRWLGMLDNWSGYNVPDEQLDELRDFKQNDMQMKGIYDYAYILEQCLNNTIAPYVAVFEDDIIFADNWLPRTLTTLASIRQRSAKWLYLRLFYTEAILGWDKDLDCWYTHPNLQLCIIVVLMYIIAFALRAYYKRSQPDCNISTLIVVTFVTLPSFIILIFMIGRNSILPLNGLERMDTKGCCTQALVFPRSQVQSVIAMLRELKGGQTDRRIETWANEEGLARYAIAPQLVQHVGLVSTRGMPKKFTRKTFAHRFEGYDAGKLHEEHEKQAQLGIWRATEDGYARSLDGTP